MKKVLFSCSLLLSLAFSASVCGQSNAPAVADNANPQDNNVKMRSAEIERVKREAAKSENSPINAKVNTKFPQIKEDFEGLQISEAAIIKAYTTGKTIDYALIETSAKEINKRAKRLAENIFTETSEPRKDDPEKKEETPPTIKSLIIELDNAIGNFVGSKIFGNLKVVDAEEAKKAHAELVKIKAISNQLAAEAAKLK